MAHAPLLALNSSNFIFSAALQDAAGTYTRAEARQPASEYALPIISDLLAQASRGLADCAAFAFGAGPGAFSSLRMVCALAQGFAYVCKKPVCAVPSLLALAYDNTNKGDIYFCKKDKKLSVDNDAPITMHCALPAHREHVYYGVCTRRAGKWTAKPARLLATTVALPVVQRQAAGNVFACGDGFLQNPNLVPAGAVLLDTQPYPTATGVVAVARQMLADGKGVAATAARPLYVRQKVAQTIVERAARAAASTN